jgi:hypothetical protein
VEKERELRVPLQHPAQETATMAVTATAARAVEAAVASAAMTTAGAVKASSPEGGPRNDAASSAGA